jgi:hypothetical protein
MTADRGAGSRRILEPLLEALASVPNSYKDVRPGAGFFGWIRRPPLHQSAFFSVAPERIEVECNDGPRGADNR